VLDLADGSETVASLVVAGGANTATLTFRNGNADTNRLIVTSDASIGPNGVLTHAANVAGIAHRLFLDVGGNLTIASNGAVWVRGRGYASGTGPGNGGGSSGGVHGGEGGEGSEGGRIATPTYGSLTNPVTAGGGSGPTYGAAGGGVAILRVAGCVTLGGKVDADGGDANPGGAGAGGSVSLRAATLLGNGSISANGGKGAWANGGGGGGGGRIAVVLTDAATVGNVAMSAVGGSGGSANLGYGGAGTIYLQGAKQTHGLLIVSNAALTGTAGARTLISPAMSDAVVGDVRLLDQTTLAIDAGKVLEVYGNWSSAVPALTVSGAGTVEFKGGAAGTISGSTTFSNLKCVVPGKTLQFEGGSTQSVSGRLTLAGAEGKLLALKPAAPGTRWKLNAVLGSTSDICCVQVSDSDAVALDPILAFDSDGASAKNDNWAFGPATNVWTGSESTAWEARQNWSLGRLPTYADTVVIPEVQNGPVLDSDREIGSLVLNAGAVLDMNSRILCVRGDVRNAGKISGQGTLRLTGAVVQSVTAGGNAFDIVEVAGSGRVSFADGFAAARFACRVPGADLAFNSGSMVKIDVLDLLGAPGKLVKIRSSLPPAVAKWKLTGHAVVYYADVSDHDASGGYRICAVDSTGNGHTPNWDFTPRHCRGGVETEKFIGDVKYRIHTFTNSGTLVVNRNTEIEYLIVGGGGGGGNQFQGGGGGAGGFLEGKAQVTNGVLSVVVGAGGKAGLNGGNSSITGVGVAIGGGCGGKESQPPSVGGSGGGGCHGPSIQGAAGTPGQGNAGGDGGGTRGGGGGGAGGPGKASDDLTLPYAGGLGLVSAITGENVTYAAGGAGRHRSESGQGKAGGDNTGDGGGGCTWNDAAGAGGSGIVVVRYKLDIHNRPVSKVTLNGATFNAYLVRANPAPARVSVLWGEDNGVASGAWEHTNSWKAGDWGADSRPSTNMILAANRGYYYTFEVTCGTNQEVADVPVSFMTGALEVKATQRESTEEKPAAFVISRPATATNGHLAVYYTLSGTGINGTDYDPLESPAVITAGLTEVRLPVVPNFNMGETRSKGVELTLAPGGYYIGVNGKASIVTKAQ
jgi:hypothetical protein